MKVAVSGSRHARWVKPGILLEPHIPADMTEILVGDCPTGVDSYVRGWCETQGIPYTVFEADWQKHGKKAGPIRNREMLEHADRLIAFWDGESPGTQSAIRMALRRNIPVEVYSINDPEEAL